MALALRRDIVVKTLELLRQHWLGLPKTSRCLKPLVERIHFRGNSSFPVGGGGIIPLVSVLCMTMLHVPTYIPILDPAKRLSAAAMHMAISEIISKQA